MVSISKIPQLQEKEIAFSSFWAYMFVGIQRIPIGENTKISKCCPPASFLNILVYPNIQNVEFKEFKRLKVTFQKTRFFEL